MAIGSVTIDSGPISANDSLGRVPKEKWHDLMLARRQFMEINLTYDCRCLIEFVEDAKLMYETLGFVDVEAMIREGYNLVPEEIEVAVEWLRLNPIEDPVPIEVTRANKARKDDEISKSHKGGRGKKLNDNIIGFTKDNGTSMTALLRRIARRAPRSLERYERGEFKSVRAAAIDAGIVKPATGIQLLRSAWKKATKEERDLFVEEVIEKDKIADNILTWKKSYKDKLEYWELMDHNNRVIGKVMQRGLATYHAVWKNRDLGQRITVRFAKDLCEEIGRQSGYEIREE